jgi:BirA family biotin operon repressor/biotin-[acetyl-CoA-carboxylase] ligase
MADDFTNIASDFPEPYRLLVRESAESTNDELRALAEHGAASGMVLLALEQTNGRGRRGNQWFSPPEASLAFSVLVRPQEPKSLWPRLALSAGLAVAEAMESFGIRPGIKWPNDVWIGSRKVAGVLVEAGEDFAVIGIGINVNTKEFPADVASIATSMWLESGWEHPRHEVLAAVIQRLAARSRQIGVDFNDLLDSLRQRCVLTGRRVSLMTAGGPLDGVVEGIAAGGELLLRSDQDLHRLIQADEVRILE